TQDGIFSDFFRHPLLYSIHHQSRVRQIMRVVFFAGWVSVVSWAGAVGMRKRPPRFHQMILTLQL
ncbi:hypothetical protein, partial [Acinetobacter towneri]|uniref:hypothetical protein n=1 Tax=Acinetobacter towneri TaxID=202956 RepID=UPI0029355D42